MSTIPTVEETRKRIEKVDVKQIRLCLKIIYLTASRVSEMVGYSTPRDTSIARGPRGTDLSTATYNHYNKPIPTAIFHLKIAKRGGKPKLLALPLEKQYEPWTQELVDYFKSRGGEFVFPYSRQQIWAVARPAFEGLKYPIEKYKVFEDGKIIKEKGLRK